MLTLFYVKHVVNTFILKTNNHNKRNYYGITNIQKRGISLSIKIENLILDLFYWYSAEN